MKTYNKKFNAKRATDSLVKKFPGYSAGDPVDTGNGEWAPNMIAPQRTIDEGVPEELAKAAYINGRVHAEPEPQQEPAPQEAADPTPINARAGSKKEIVANMLLRKEGATAKAILAATGWKALNIPGTARSLGIVLRQVKEGRTTTYYGSQ